MRGQTMLVSLFIKKLNGSSIISGGGIMDNSFAPPPVLYVTNTIISNMPPKIKLNELFLRGADVKITVDKVVERLWKSVGGSVDWLIKKLPPFWGDFAEFCRKRQLSTNSPSKKGLWREVVYISRIPLKWTAWRLFWRKSD